MDSLPMVFDPAVHDEPDEPLLDWFVAVYATIVAQLMDIQLLEDSSLEFVAFALKIPGFMASEMYKLTEKR